MRLAMLGAKGLKQAAGTGNKPSGGLLGAVGKVAAAQQMPAADSASDTGSSSAQNTRTVRMPLMALEGFMRLMHDAHVVDGDLTKRDIVLAFTFARLRRPDPLRGSGEMQRSTHLSFMDFLEALCRVADSHTLPTHDEMQAAGVQDPHEYFKKLDAAGLPRPRRPSGAWVAPKTRPLGVKVQLFLDRMMGGLKDRVATLRDNDSKIKSALVPTPAGGLAIPAGALAGIKDPKKAVEFVRAAAALASRAARAREVLASKSRSSDRKQQQIVLDGDGRAS